MKRLECIQYNTTKGKTRTKDVKFYNLDAMISVRYWVNSIKATNVLKEYIQKGFKIDEQRMKQGGELFGKDYFREIAGNRPLYTSK